MGKSRGVKVMYYLLLSMCGCCCRERDKQKVTPMIWHYLDGYDSDVDFLPDEKNL